MSGLKYINDMLEIAKVAVERIKQENEDLRNENKRLLKIIESITNTSKGNE